MALCRWNTGSKMTGQAALPHRNIQYRTMKYKILPVIHLTMAKADLGHTVLEKAPFYEARLIYR